MKDLTNKITIGLILLLMLPSAIATVALTSDKQDYEPGETVKLQLSYTNTGRFNVTSKFIHMDLKKFGLIVISQTRDQKKHLMPEQIESGVHIFTLPAFSPPGKYEIAGYFEFEDGTFSEERTIAINATESLMFKIIKLIIIIILAIITIGIIIRIIRWMKRKKQSKHNPAR